MKTMYIQPEVNTVLLLGQALLAGSGSSGETPLVVVPDPTIETGS